MWLWICITKDIPRWNHSRQRIPTCEICPLCFLCCLRFDHQKVWGVWQVSVDAQSTSLLVNTPADVGRVDRVRARGKEWDALQHLKGLWRQINKIPQFSLWFSCWQDAGEERVGLLVTSASSDTFCFALCAIKRLQGWSRHRVPYWYYCKKRIAFCQNSYPKLWQISCSNATISNISTLVCEYAHFALELNPMCPIASVGGWERERGGERERGWLTHFKCHRVHRG